MSNAGALMYGKRGLVMGVANDRSIAWGISKALAQHGAELAFTFQGDALEKRVRPLAESVGSQLVLPCDVTDSNAIDNVFFALDSEWKGLDFVVHAIAYSDKDELKGRYVDTSPENFFKHNEHLLLFIHSNMPTSCANDEERWQLTHIDLCGRRTRNAALQCNGRGKGSARNKRKISCC